MKTITLTDSDGGKITGQLPEGWHEVPLSAFTAYQQQLTEKPKGMEAVIAAATLTALPSDVVQSDVSIAGILLRQMPFLAKLPEPDPVLTIRHCGRTYDHVGNLTTVDASQFEALLNFLEAAEGKPAEAAPNLLAVLYRERGRAQDAASVASAAEAFASLPMDKAWGAVAFFLTSSQQYAKRIHSLSQSLAAAEKTLTSLEELAAHPSQRRLSPIRARLARAYTRYARATLPKS